jgi:xylulokinase
VLSGADAPPEWQQGSAQRFEAEAVPAIRERYAEVRDLTASRPAS